jgi:hypothetical protein
MIELFFIILIYLLISFLSIQVSSLLINNSLLFSIKKISKIMFLKNNLGNNNISVIEYTLYQRYL